MIVTSTRILPCDHCDRMFDRDHLIPVALYGAASFRGHLISTRSNEQQIMAVDAECFVLLDGAPIGRLVDLREPPSSDPNRPTPIRM